MAGRGSSRANQLLISSKKISRPAALLIEFALIKLSVFVYIFGASIQLAVPETLLPASNKAAHGTLTHRPTHIFTYLSIIHVHPLPPTLNIHSSLLHPTVSISKAPSRSRAWRGEAGQEEERNVQRNGVVKIEVVLAGMLSSEAAGNGGTRGAK